MTRIRFLPRWRRGAATLVIVMIAIAWPGETMHPKTASAAPVGAAVGEFILGKIKDYVLGVSYDPVKGTLQVGPVSAFVSEFARATIIEQGDVHAGVGDVYQLDFNLDFQRRSKRILNIGGYDKYEYWYEVYLDGQKVIEEKVEESRRDDTDFTSMPGQNVHTTRSLFLLATQLRNADCHGTDSAVVAIRAVMRVFDLDPPRWEWRLDPPGWPKDPGQNYGKTEYITVDLKPKEEYKPGGPPVDFANFPRIPGHHWTAVQVRRTYPDYLDNWTPGKTQPPEEAKKAVTIHNPWWLNLKTYPRDDVHHHDATHTDTLEFALLHSVPGYKNIGTLPESVVVNSSARASDHFTFGARKPRDGDVLTFKPDGLEFTQSYQFVTGQGDHPTRKISLSFDGKVSGRRQVKDGTGPLIDWSATPKVSGHASTAGYNLCVPYNWSIADIDEAQAAGTQPTPPTEHQTPVTGTSQTPAPVTQPTPPTTQPTQTGPQPTATPTQPAPAPAATGPIDSCLVGRWRSEPVTEVSQQGGAGIVLTIDADGTESVDYKGMQSLKDAINGGTNLWAGTATGHITTDKGTATVTSIEKSDLTLTYTPANGPSRTNRMSGLGPAGLGYNPLDRHYTCDEAKLTFKSPPFTFTFTFKRDKGR